MYYIGTLKNATKHSGFRVASIHDITGHYRVQLHVIGFEIEMGQDGKTETMDLKFRLERIDASVSKWAAQLYPPGHAQLLNPWTCTNRYICKY